MCRFCEEDGLGQVAKLLVLLKSALDPRFWVGKVRQEDVDECVGEVGLEVTVQEQQGRRVKHEKGEGEVKRDDMRTQTTFHVLEPCVCVTGMKMCEVPSERAVRRKMCVQHVSVCTPRRTHSSCYYVSATPLRGSSLLTKIKTKNITP